MDVIELPIVVGLRVESRIGEARLGVVVARHEDTVWVVWDEWIGKEPSEVAITAVKPGGSLLDQLAWASSDVVGITDVCSPSQ